MTSSNNDDSYNENTCVVCFKNVEIFSIGDCDHPVCYECSTRMRVLCRQNECPICRHDMQKVIFTRTVQPFKELDKSIGTINLMIDRKFKIVFESTSIQRAYNTLLAHVCSVCPGRHAFQTYNNLRDHMRKEHELFYCDLCVENLKILTHERRCYTRKELAMHRRQGDLDNRSHRGHPLCEFCDRRYMDNDELYRHLRRDHLFCHFCDADGLHQYYDSYEVLRNHFRDQHYLCEEGDCYDEKFTSAFRTDIDLKAHRASVHGRQMTKAAAKQARTLELAFTLKPRPRPHQDRHRPDRHSRYNQQSDEEEGAVGGSVPERNRHFQPSQPQAVAKQRINTASNDEFPTLGGGNAPLTAHGVHFRKPGVSVRTGNSLAMTEEDFPALASDGPSQSLSVRLSKGVSIHVNSRPGQVTTTVSTAPSRDPFPALGNKAPSRPLTSQPQWSAVRQCEPKSKPTQPLSRPTQPKSIKTSHYDEDFPLQNNFPALGGNVPSHIANLAATQWSSGREPEAKFSVNKNKPSHPSPPKPPQPKTFHIEDDFPSLNSRFDASCSFTPEPRSAEPKPLPERKIKKESSISIPVDNDWNKIVKGPANVDNISSDSDIGSKKGSKKKNKSKTKKELQSEATKPSSANNNNNETGKKNKQKDEPKSKSKQIKVEEKKESTKENAVEKKKPQEAERKRSELKIESLNGQSSSESNVNGNNNINMNDFPSLGNNRLPPGFVDMAVKEKPATAPPGFESSVSAPPGFNITLNSVARPINGLTFTSSSGHNYPISSGDGRVFSYVAPPNVKSRNTSLVSHVTEALGTQTALDEFLQMSSQYRQGSLTAEAYYNHCQTAMGADAFKQVFPELLVLLPDIEKQQDLWKVAERPKEWKLNVCAACGQVVSSADFRHHHSTHSLENHFPALSNGAPSTNSAWTHK